MTEEEKIIKALSRPTFYFKGMTVNMFGIPVASKKSLYTALSRLRKKNYITKEGTHWKVSPDGKRSLKRRTARLQTFASSFPKEAPKNLIVMFDIPEPRKSEREWFRFQIRRFGYAMIQKSVWVGPSPLPKEFTDYLKQIKLMDMIKTFKLAKPYSIKS